MKRRTLLFALIASLVSLLLFPITGYAQGNLGALTGTVQDSTGAVVPDAAITITKIDTGVKWTAKTSSAGYYRAPVPPGTYKVQAEKAGFKTAIADQIIVPVAQVVTVDLRLQVGNISETVEVTSQAPLLQTSTAEVSSSVNPQEFETLPILIDDGGRDLQSFIFRSLPGTVGSSWSGSINGGQLFSHEILIDGVTIGRFDLSGGGLSEFQPPTDSIGEFKVQSSNYSAEYGETGGGVANFTYKSGTNDFHGSAFEYLKNPVFNAPGVFVVQGSPKDNVKENNFGFQIGGPIRKGHTFFFFTYEGDRYRDFSFSGWVTIPTAAMRSGDFSQALGSQLQTCGDTGDQLCFDALNRPVYQGEIYDPTTTRSVGGEIVRDGFGFDPATGLPIAGQANVIPAGMISTASAQLLPLFPDPLRYPNPADPSQTYNNTPKFNGGQPTLTRDAYTIKIDHVLTGKQKIWGSFTHNWRDLFKRNANTFPPFPGQPINPYKQQQTGGPQVRIAHAWTISDRSLNNFQFGFNRFQNANNLTNNAKYFPSALVGVPSTCFPGIALSAAGSFIPGIPKSFGAACKNIDPAESWVLQDYFSYLRGKHNLKIGGEFRYYRYNTYEPGPLGGSFSFTDVETGLPSFSKKTGTPFASFVLGAVNHATRPIYFTAPHYRAGLYSFYVQDDFKATPKLSLNLGLRWEIPMPQRETNNRESGFNATLPNPGADNIPGAMEFLGGCSACNHRSSFMDWYFKQFAPRIGVAYQIAPKLVFRGGYGISYAPPIEDNFGTQNYWGFSDAVNANKGSARRTTGFSQDPAIYWSPLTSAPLPTAAKVGISPYTGTLPNQDPAGANGNGVDFLPRNGAREPYTQNWSVGFQYMAAHDILLQADYMGSKGTRLLNGYFGSLFNQAPTKYMGLGDYLTDDLQCALTNGTSSPDCDAADYPNSQAILAQYGITGLPYPSFEDNNYDTSVSAAIQPYPQYYSIQNNYPTMGSSTYHSLQLMARKTTNHGLTFTAAYTWSKLLTDTDSALFQSGSENVQDIWNPRAEKAIASYDYTHVFKLSWFYDLPFGRGRRWLNSGGALDRVIGGWQLTAIQNYYSGDPLSIGSSLSLNYQSTYGLRGDVVPGVPQRVHSGPLDIVNGTPYLNPAAFADPPQTSSGTGIALRYGNSPDFLPTTRGPAHLSEDFGIVKNTRLTERFNIQFRADMFNVFNRTGLGDPVTSLGDPQFGLVTGPMNGPRVIQFALRLNF